MTDSAIDAPAPATDVDRLTKVARTLSQLRGDLEHAVEGPGPWDDVHPQHRRSAKNLTQYLKLRQYDVRDLQVSLAELGLSSLGRLESQVEATVAAVDRAVRRQLAGPDASTSATALDNDAAELDLGHNADQLLGHPRDGRRTRIMVTMPSEAAHDARLVSRIVRSGIEAIRINCAHDGPDEWQAMINNVRAAEREQQVDVKVIMDLAGPKLRTGPIEPAPPVRKIKPTRDPLGHVTVPARVWLSANGVELDDADAVRIPVQDTDWLAARDIGEEIHCTDSRGSKRALTVCDVLPGGVLCELEQTCYFVPGLELHGDDDKVARVGALATSEQKLKVYAGDVITLTRDLTPIDPSSGELRIGCTLPEVFTDVAPGDRVFFDDGKIGGEVSELAADTIRVQVTDIAPKGAKLGAAKGINLPDTTLNLPALTEEDAANLPFVVAHADAVSLSFVRAAGDVALLHERLRSLGGDALGIILKIETVSGFENLPEILFESMKWRSIGVMIARGDLAVEAGYEMLAEVQEEIMWLCEAAHVPVIWATQVLDNLAKTGRPSRAEVTDAAMSGRAECVMLNKGPYVGNAVTLLTGILTRMAQHHTKKRALMRRIHAWGPERPHPIVAGG